MRRRWLALMVAAAMFAPAAVSAAEGAMATWLSPQPGEIVSGGRVEIAIGYNTQSNIRVSSLELYADGKFVVRKVLVTPQSRGVCSFYWDTTRVEQGTHNIVVKVFAGDQMISKVYGTATVGPARGKSGLIDVKPPIVTFANIKSGDVLKGTKTIKMNAADDSGQSPMVSLLVDDVLKLLRNTPPYQYDLDTTTYPDGDHSLKTYAYDAAGNRSDPAVVKVSFRNGSDKPIVTTMNINAEVAPDVSSASVSAVPPSIGVSAQSSIKESGRTAPSIEPSRSIAPAVAAAKVEPKPKTVAAMPRTEIAPKPALPAPKLESKLKPALIAASGELRASHPSPKPDARMAAALPVVKTAATAQKPVAPALSVKPARAPSPATSPNVRKTNASPAISAGLVATKPAADQGVQLSGIRSTSASHLPAIKQAKVIPESVHAATSAAPRVSEPEPVLAAPKPAGAPRPNEPVTVAIAPQSLSARATDHKPAAHEAASTAPAAVNMPVGSGVRNVAVHRQAATVKTTELAFGKISSAVSAAPATIAAPALSKSDLKRVQVAMAPDVRSAISRTATSPAIGRPPAVPKNAEAKLEKKFACPASGKVKARTFFENMGGVLFWDPATHIVTVCINDMVLELRIGSKIARVNGHDLQMRTAPYLANGRTIFEADTFTQALALLDSLRTVGKAEVH